MSTVYFALVETVDGTGTAKPIWTTRDPELLRLVWRHLRKRLDPVAHKNPAPRTRQARRFASAVAVNAGEARSNNKPTKEEQ